MKVLALTQGDPAGIGPELALKLATGPGGDWRPLLVAETAALESVRARVPGADDLAFERFDRLPSRDEVEGLAAGAVALVDPVGEARSVTPGTSGPADAAGAMAALDAGVALARSGVADALVTGPISKASVARHHLRGFRGHTDYIAAACGLEAYGRDYLMGFLAPDLQVALLTTHLPLVDAIERIDRGAIVEALVCLDRHAGGRIGVAGVNPHAGEGGLLGAEDRALVAPAVRKARERGVDARGPESPDSIFARARRGDFDWVLALYHDQGLIAVKTAAFGRATNWTIGLPILRTSVDHGTAFGIAGRGVADVEPLRRVVETTLALVAGELPRRA